MTPRVKRLLRQANNVESLGKRTAAEKLYRDLLTEVPDEPEALLGLARVTRDEAEQRATFERVIELDPKNEAAWAGLAGDWLEPPAPETPAETPVEEPVAPAPVVAAPAIETSTVELPDTHVDLAPPPAAAVPTHRHTDSAESNSADDEEVVGLTCNKCGKAIDIKTAVHTPVGYRCKECVRELEDSYFTAKATDYVLAVLVALPLSFIAGYIVPWVGFFVFFLAAGMGTLIGTLTLRAIGKRRGRYIPALVGVCIAVGALAPMFIGAVSFLNLWSGVYAFIATSAAYYRLRS